MSGTTSGTARGLASDAVNDVVSDEEARVSVMVTGVGLALAGVRTPADLLGPLPADADPVDPAARLGRKGLRYKDRATQLALCGARDALADAQLLDESGKLNVPGESVAMIAASDYGNADTVCKVVETIAAEGSASGVSPMDTPNASSNVIASTVAIKYGLCGPNLMICSGPTSGLDALRWARLLLTSRRADRALVIGVEPDNPVVRRLTGADRVVDGAAAVVLEGAEQARERGIRPHAALGRGVRGADAESCFAALRASSPRNPAVRFGPVAGADGASLPADGPATRDVGAAWGETSALLGVLQCVQATAWLADGRGGPVHAVAGRPGDGGVAGLAVLEPGAA